MENYEIKKKRKIEQKPENQAIKFILKGQEIMFENKRKYKIKKKKQTK